MQMVPTEKTFSVIVPFLNEAEWLPQCLQALRKQTLTAENFELIFVDNGSTDASLEILTGYPEVLVLHEPIRDSYMARNRGIAAATTQYLVFLDADCLPDSDWLEQIAAVVASTETVVALGYIAFPKPVSLFLRAHENYYDAKLRYLTENRLTRCYFGHAGNMVVHASIFRELGLFPAMPIVGDTEIIHRILNHSPNTELRYIAGARVTHAEVGSFRECIQKIYETGTYSQSFIEVSDHIPVPLSDRVRILRLCIKLHSYDWSRMAITILALAAGAIAFQLGRWKVIYKGQANAAVKAALL